MSSSCCLATVPWELPHWGAVLLIQEPLVPKGPGRGPSAHGSPGLGPADRHSCQGYQSCGVTIRHPRAATGAERCPPPPPGKLPVHWNAGLWAWSFLCRKHLYCEKVARQALGGAEPSGGGLAPAPTVDSTRLCPCYPPPHSGCSGNVWGKLLPVMPSVGAGGLCCPRAQGTQHQAAIHSQPPAWTSHQAWVVSLGQTQCVVGPHLIEYRQHQLGARPLTAPQMCVSLTCPSKTFVISKVEHSPQQAHFPSTPENLRTVG